MSGYGGNLLNRKDQYDMLLLTPISSTLSFRYSFVTNFGCALLPFLSALSCLFRLLVYRRMPLYYSTYLRGELKKYVTLYQ